ncbi:hypothetical protein AB0D08_01895 [Kitasatospora sp. NPDC048540]|uniref:Rv1733c family protein n=1 Tax=Kitasatospora sp. NPDC048540 TaxID=3155634 RepID=UPI0033DF3167
MTGTPLTRPTRPWRRSLRRALGTERNTLARPEDRARSHTWLLAAVATGLAVLLGGTAAWSAFGSAQHRAAAAASRLHHIEAVLLTPTRSTAGNAGSAAASYRATATWTYPGEQAHTGTVEIEHRADANSTVGVWVGDTGRLATAPAGTADLVSDGLSLGLSVLGLLLVLIVCGLGLRLRSLNRRSDAAWQRAWAETEPVWSGRATHRPGTGDPRLG